MAETTKDFPRRFHLGPATIGPNLVIILLAAAPLVMDAFFGWSAYRQVRALGYDTTTGVVTASAVKEHESTGSRGPRHTYGAAVKYRYFVAGKAYSGNRVRYAQGSSNDDSAWRAVHEYPVGKQVPVYYCPEDPADSLLHPGLEGFDLFIGMFLLPFNLFPVFVFAQVVSRIWGRCFGYWGAGAKVWDDGSVVRVRLPRVAPLFLAFFATGIVAFLAVFPVGFFCGGFHPSKSLMYCVWPLVLGSFPLGYVVAARRQSRGGCNLVIDTAAGKVLLPSTFGRKSRDPLPLDEVTSIEVRDANPPGASGGLCYSACLTLVFTAADGTSTAEKLTQWADPGRAESLAAWLRQRLKVEG
jgi:hypothetical protein